MTAVVDLTCKQTARDSQMQRTCKNANSLVKMNRTFFDRGFKKEVETKSGKRFDVSAGLPKSIKVPNKQVRYEICNESFTAKKYVDTHVRLKHPSHDSRIIHC